MRPALITLLLFLSACHAKDDYLLRVNDSISGNGYVNLKGDTVIPIHKYNYCFTDTFRTYAIVSKPKVGMVAIDRNERVLFKVFIFDNEPDEVSDGYFRIIKDNKIGYADTLGNMAIKPKYGCAMQFKNGIAKVSINCEAVNIEDEHPYWKSNNWFFIDKLGKRVK